MKWKTFNYQRRPERRFEKRKEEEKIDEGKINE
jgi:hypothetical protein